MKSVLFWCLVMSSQIVHAQIFNCGAAGSSGISYKLEMKIDIGDSLVIFTSQGKETIYKRIPSTSAIYFTDGVVTNSITASPSTGKMKGFTYNSILNVKTNINSGKPGESTHFCWRKD